MILALLGLGVGVAVEVEIWGGDGVGFGASCGVGAGACGGVGARADGLSFGRFFFVLLCLLSHLQLVQNLTNCKHNLLTFQIDKKEKYLHLMFFTCLVLRL